MQVTLPTSIGDQLNTTNNLQHQYDRKLATIGSIREQVYADWYKYAIASYLSNKQRLPDAEKNPRIHQNG